MNDNHYVGKILRRRYKILQKIGEGGYGDTYRAIDCDYPGQPHCVVKHFKPKNTLHPSMLEIAKGKFNQEAEILSRLGKSNKQIPKLCAYFEENEQFFLVQEFIDGHDLSKEIFAQGYFDTEQKVLQLLIEVLEVLAFVHQQNVIHRDIKPHNIMRRKDGKVVLIDFGAVKQVVNLGVNSQGQTCLTVTIGTPGYMPIEQQSGHPDFSSDIYALGIIGFQALASLNSFNVNPVRLPRDFDTGEFSCAMLPGWSNISPAFAQILDKMVRYDYRERYENASQALEELQNLQRGNQASRVAVTSSSYANTISSQNPQNANFNGNVSIESDESETSSFQKIAAFFRGSSSQTSSFQRIIGFLRDVLLIDYEPDTFPQLPAASNPAVVPSDAASNPAAIPSPAVVPSPAAVSSPGVNSNHYEQPEGQVSLSSVFYIERPPIESDCYGTILQPGALICIKAPRQMGKTSLLSRTLNYARQQGNQAAYLNFQSADAQFLNSFDKFLQWFCGSIAQELNLPDRLDQYWQGVLGSKNKSTNYFQRYLLSEIKTPLILGLDEVD
ncbi:MAG: serine/threonine-protein kinase, partial [Cyanobacteria bacterium P01_A01_bin.80]